MSIVILYGAYSLFFSSSKKNTGFSAEVQMKQLHKLITDVSVGLSKDNLTEIEIYTIARAEAGWEKDPFFMKKDHTAGKMGGEFDYSAPASLGKFNYSGYIEIGGKKMAIINNMEYETGDELEPGLYFIRGIDPAKVVIEIGETQEKIVIPIVEEVL